MNEDCIVLIGTRPAITSAKLILETQVSLMLASQLNASNLFAPLPPPLADGVYDEKSAVV
jgi:hypothetical protein